MIRLLIFDLDGTLIDSAPDIVTSVNNLLISRNLDPLPPATIRGAIGEGTKMLVWHLFRAQIDDKKFLDQLEADLMMYYDKHLLDTTVPFPGAVDFLKACEQKIAIVSNKHEAFVRKTIGGLELREFPWLRMYGADSFPVKKPDPLPLREVMAAAGCAPEETLMIGDGIPDMKAAIAAGVRPVACEFGYTAPDVLLGFKPYASIKSFAELADVVASIR